MTRPLRIDAPGMWHHVMNRGLGKSEIFAEDEDRRAFLELVGEIGPRWDVWPCGFCLMDNHYHLILQDESGRLSRAMRHIDGVYTQRFNRKYSRDGPLMRGRFRSRVVDAERYAVELVRYLHMNPVRAGIVRRARQYPWSSHRAYLGLERVPGLRTRSVKELLGLDGDQQEHSFDVFVHARMDAEVSSALSGSMWTAVLGSEDFIETCRATVRRRPDLRVREVSAGHRLASLDPEAVIVAACEEFGLPRRELVWGRRGSLNRFRLATIVLCREMTPTKLEKIGRLFGVCASTASALALRGRKLAQEEHSMQHALARLKRRVLAK